MSSVDSVFPTDLLGTLVASVNKISAPPRQEKESLEVPCCIQSKIQRSIIFEGNADFWEVEIQCFPWVGWRGAEGAGPFPDGMDEMQTLWTCEKTIEYVKFDLTSLC